MSKHVDTAFERHFSEPPVVAVKEGRTHCEACKEPLDPNVMHKCHGNQEYQAPAFSHTEITEACPACHKMTGRLFDVGGAASAVVVCEACRIFVAAPVADAPDAIHWWNAIVRSRGDVTPEDGWPKWRAALPGEDERTNVIQGNTMVGAQSVQIDLSAYKGACPAVHVDGQVCDWCDNTGTIPPTKPEGAQ